MAEAMWLRGEGAEDVFVKQPRRLVHEISHELQCFKEARVLPIIGR